MKNFLLMLTGTFLAAGCDKVNAPLQDYEPPVEVKRKVLLEDYTGHQCGNCPYAAEAAEKLQHQYGDNLIVVAVHAGYFAALYPPDYTTSYTTTAGNDWNTYFGIVGNPQGMTNRKNYSANGRFNTYTKWPTTVSLGFQDEYILDLDIVPFFDEATATVEAQVTGKFAKAYNKNVKVSVVLIEDSVIGTQLDYRVKDNPVVKDYVFMHMLRGSLNDSWGSTLKKAPAAADDEVSVFVGPLKLNPGFKPRHLSLVAFAFDEQTREVLEAEKVKLLPAGSEQF